MKRLNPYEPPQSSLARPVDGLASSWHSALSWAGLGALVGPLSALVVSWGCFGPEHLLWWQSRKGGETFLTPLGRVVVVALMIGGSLAGAACGRAIDRSVVRRAGLEGSPRQLRDLGP